MTKIILVRHGETEWNQGEERFRGRADLALTPRGIKQAQAAARRLAQEGITAVYSSPLKRAWQTAQNIAEPLNLSPQPLEGLSDINYGAWQGLSPAEVAERYGELFAIWRNTPHLVTLPGGESLEKVHQRVEQALEYVNSTHPEGTVAFISHLVVCRVMVAHFLGWDLSHFWQIEQDLAAVSIFELRSPQPLVQLINDTCHLTDST